MTDFFVGLDANSSVCYAKTAQGWAINDYTPPLSFNFQSPVPVEAELFQNQPLLILSHVILITATVVIVVGVILGWDH